MTDQSKEKRVLALDVHPRSFGFVEFEGPNRMLDWGVRSFRPGVNAVKIPAATKFLALLDDIRLLDSFTIPTEVRNTLAKITSRCSGITR
jgi:hypothetical protein